MSRARWVYLVKVSTSIAEPLRAIRGVYGSLDRAWEVAARLVGPNPDKVDNGDARIVPATIEAARDDIDVLSVTVLLSRDPGPHSPSASIHRYRLDE